jgi:hypothetical protein
MVDIGSGVETHFGRVRRAQQIVKRGLGPNGESAGWFLLRRK